jgi:hypothetical protein
VHPEQTRILQGLLTNIGLSYSFLLFLFHLLNVALNVRMGELDKLVRRPPAQSAPWHVVEVILQYYQEASEVRDQQPPATHLVGALVHRCPHHASHSLSFSITMGVGNGGVPLNAILVQCSLEPIAMPHVVVSRHMFRHPMLGDDLLPELLPDRMEVRRLLQQAHLHPGGHGVHHQHQQQVTIKLHIVNSPPTPQTIGGGFTVAQHFVGGWVEHLALQTLTKKLFTSLVHAPPGVPQRLHAMGHSHSVGVRSPVRSCQQGHQ